MLSGLVDYDTENQAAYIVGQALGQLQAAQQPQERGVRQLTSQQAFDRAHKLVGRAFQLYLRGGLTQQQAAQRIVALAEMFSALE